jgi:hypothetical protein
MPPWVFVPLSMDWVIAAISVVIVLSCATAGLHALQLRGVPWACGVGFPLAKHQRGGHPSTPVLPSPTLVVTRRGPVVTLRERTDSAVPPVWLRYCGVVGRAEAAGPRTRVRFVTDAHTTLSWLLLAFVVGVMAVMPLLAPGPTTWEVQTFWFGIAGLMTAIFARIVAGSVRRARRRAADYAARLGDGPLVAGGGALADEPSA